MFLYFCSQSKAEVDSLKEKVEDIKKQINNIYELLEVSTNESKARYKNLNENNNVPKENNNKTKHTYFIDKTTI